jgi:hypothetical protein
VSWSSSFELGNGKVMLVGRSPRGRRTWHRVRLTQSPRSPQSFLLSLLGDLEVRSFGGGADFVAQQTMLCCARRLMGYGKLQGKKCAPLGREVCTFQVRSVHLGYINRVVNYVFPHFQL